VACDNDWRNGKYHIDLWVGGQGGNTNAVIACENSLTQSNGQVIIDPASNEPVDTTPLFNSATNQCYNPSSFPGGGGPTTNPTSPSGGHAITGLGGKCVDVAGASSANGTAVQLYTCNGTGAQSWTHTGTTFRALGKCLDVSAASTANGAKVQIYDCNGTNAQNWTAGSNGSLVNTGSGKCLDATGNTSADGTKLQLWSCTGAANQRWAL
jgi:chitinase